MPATGAEACADYLQRHWVGGRLQLRQGHACQGYTTYGKVLDAHYSEQQRKTTLLITNSAAHESSRTHPEPVTRPLHARYTPITVGCRCRVTADAVTHPLWWAADVV